MKVIVDTSVWSLVLRRKRRDPSPHADELRSLIDDNRVQMIGPIRQELLSGIRSPVLFEKLQMRLAAFPDLRLATDDYVEAARCYNDCRSVGIQATHVDFLICAIASRRRLAVFSMDNDFKHIAARMPIEFHKASAS
jgi:hypothetical protein